MDDVVPYCLDSRRLLGQASRCSVVGLCIRFVIRVCHPLFCCLPIPFQRDRLTRRTEALHDFALEPVRHRTNQYALSFIPAFVDKWNDLDNSVFAGVGLGSFKNLVSRYLFG